jgi:hypothetical protein
MLVREIGDFFGVSLANIRNTEPVRTAAIGPGHWRFVCPTLVGLRQKESPFNLDSMLERAKSTVFCAGFNLNHIATSEELHSKLLKWLKKPNRSVQLLVSDPANELTFAAWRLVGETYIKDLHKSVENFRKWLKEAKTLKSKRRLDIRKTEFFPQTVLAIDPNSQAGEIVITPTIHGKHLPGERPHFWLSKARHPEIFAHFWPTYEDVFKRAKPLDK